MSLLFRIEALKLYTVLFTNNETKLLTGLTVHNKNPIFPRKNIWLWNHLKRWVL